MRVKTNLPNCILCLSRPADSLEHIIPKAIGGKLSAFLLCTKCNNTLGSELVNDIKKDPSIRLAMQKLKDRIPEIVKSIEDGQNYYGRDKDGKWIKHILKKTKYKVVEGKSREGSLILDEKNIESYITKKLKKEKASESYIKEIIGSINKAQENEVVKINDDLNAIKKPINEFTPSLENSFISLRAIALIAYEFLALLIGELIYDKDFDEIREYILNNIESEKVVINRFIQKDRKYAPYYKIFPEFFKEKTSITISFFGFIIFQVDFYFHIPKVIDYVIVQDLENKKILFADSLQDAKQNKYFILK